MNGTPGRVVADDNVIAAKHTIIKTRPRREARRCLVTGGAGFVGSHLCEYLVNRGDYVSAKNENSTSPCNISLLASRFQVICLDNFFTGSKENVAHLIGKDNFEVRRPLRSIQSSSQLLSAFSSFATM
jgi:UDP-glucose 4-epimerase